MPSGKLCVIYRCCSQTMDTQISDIFKVKSLLVVIGLPTPIFRTHQKKPTYLPQKKSIKVPDTI
uniref:Uncharacterized protein n=1 Tax=Arion vulgaris TaxID=1028688 RepID=A0A0B7BHJ1_9EUPU